MSERIRTQAYDVWTVAPAEFATCLRADHARRGRVVKAAGGKAE